FLEVLRRGADRSGAHARSRARLPRRDGARGGGLRALRAHLPRAVVQLLRLLESAVVIRACVTGLGAVSGFGRGVERFWAGLVAGRRAMRAHPLSPSPIAFVEEAGFDAPERASLLAR